MTRNREGLRRLSRVGLVLAGVLGGVIFFHLAVMPIVVRHGSEVQTPDLRGLTAAEGRLRLERSDLIAGDVTEVFDDEVAVGRVVRQDPRAGFRVKTGREVRLVVSQGTEARHVPELSGESIDHARFLLSQTGLVLGEIYSVHSSAVPRSQVVASRPRAGFPVPGGRSVDLLVSLGPLIPRFVMPDLRARAVSAAEAALRAAGFQVSLRERPGSSGRGNRIAAQQPPAGSPLAAGALIELVVDR